MLRPNGLLMVAIAVWALQDWPVASSVEAVETAPFGGWTLDSHLLRSAGRPSPVRLHSQPIPQLVSRCCLRRRGHCSPLSLLLATPLSGCSTRWRDVQDGGPKLRRLAEASDLENGKPVPGSQSQSEDGAMVAAVRGSYLYLSGRPHQPVVGDVRLSWIVRPARGGAV